MFKLTKDTLPVFKLFKFKNLKNMNVRNGMAYTCELFYQNQKIADVENRGDGGETWIDYADGGEELLDSLNVPQYFDKDEDLGFDIDNEYIISDLVEVAIWLKGVMRKQSSAILFIKGDNLHEIKLKVPVTKYVELNKMDILTDKVKQLENDGFVVLNTNIG
jgi:hypothetical protein